MKDHDDSVKLSAMNLPVSLQRAYASTNADSTRIGCARRGYLVRIISSPTCFQGGDCEAWADTGTQELHADDCSAPLPHHWPRCAVVLLPLPDARFLRRPGARCPRVRPPGRTRAGSTQPDGDAEPGRPLLARNGAALRHCNASRRSLLVLRLVGGECVPLPFACLPD